MIRIYSMLLTALCVISCSKEPSLWETKRVVVAGRIDHAVRDSSGRFSPVQFQFNRLLKQKGQNAVTVLPDSAGNFVMEMQLAYPQEVLMLHRGGYHLCLTPGDSLYIHIRYDTLPSGPGFNGQPAGEVDFSGGSSAAVNRSMWKLQQHYRPVLEKYRQEDLKQAVSNRMPEAFQQYIDQRESDYRQVWESFRQTDDYVPELSPWVEDILRYDALFGMTSYANIMQRVHTEQPELGMPPLPAGYTEFLKRYDQQDNRIISQAHALFLDQYDQHVMFEIYNELNQNDQISSDEQAIEFLCRRLDEKTQGFTNELVRGIFYLEMLQSGDSQDLIDRYVRPESFKNSYLQDKITESRERLNTLRSAPLPDGVHMVRLNPDISAGIFDSIVAPYAGKVIYMDFWAPWCSPCINQMPSSKDLQQHFKNQDVVFLFLCGQSSDDAWRAAIISHGITGIHYKPSPDQINQLYEQLGIEEIPHYLVVDKKGKVSNSNAPMPGTLGGAIKEINDVL